MKKTLSVLLIVTAVLLAFVSCNAENDFSEELVNVTLTSLRSRALDATTDFDLSDVTKWKYTASKADQGLATGATTTKTELIDGKNTNPLSQGRWNFELFGYNSSDELICSGSVKNVLITVSDHLVSINVKALQTDTGTGVIAISDDISLKAKDNTTYDASVYAKYTRDVKVYKAGENAEVTDLTNVASGTYKVVVAYTLEGNEVAKGIKYINVFDNLTTTVSGTVEEVTQAAEVTKTASLPEAIVASKTESVAVDESGKNKAAATFNVESAAVEDTSKTETKVTFPIGALNVDSTSSEAKDVSLKVSSSTIKEASSIYTITDSTGAVVAGFDFDLTGVENSTFNSAVEIETYIAKGLGDKSTLSIAGETTDAEGSAPTILEYDTETGYIKFSVHHFSSYVIVSSKYVATDEKGNLYETLQAAIDSDSNTIYILKDIDLEMTSAKNTTPGIAIKRSITIDGNNHMLYNDGDMAKSARLLQIENIAGGTVTVRNLTVSSSKYSSYFRAIQINGNTDTTINFENVHVSISEYYPIQIGTGNTNSRLNLTNCETMGWCAIYNHSSYFTVDAKDCHFISVNNQTSGESNSFSCIIVSEYYHLDSNTEKSEHNSMTFTGCIFDVSRITSGTDSVVRQQIADLRSPCNNTLKLDNCTLSPAGSEEYFEVCTDSTYGGNIVPDEDKNTNKVYLDGADITSNTTYVDLYIDR